MNRKTYVSPAITATTETSPHMTRYLLGMDAPNVLHRYFQARLLADKRTAVQKERDSWA